MITVSWEQWLCSYRLLKLHVISLSHWFQAYMYISHIHVHVVNVLLLILCTVHLYSCHMLGWSPLGLGLTSKLYVNHMTCHMTTISLYILYIVWRYSWEGWPNGGGGHTQTRLLLHTDHIQESVNNLHSGQQRHSSHDRAGGPNHCGTSRTKNGEEGEKGKAEVLI